MKEKKKNKFLSATPFPGFLSTTMFYKCLYLASSCFSFNAATRLPAMQGHKLCYAIDYVTYHMISCFCFTFISQLIKTPLCLCSRLSFLDANPLSWWVPQINNPPVLHISLSGPQFPATFLVTTKGPEMAGLLSPLPLGAGALGLGRPVTPGATRRTLAWRRNHLSTDLVPLPSSTTKPERSYRTISETVHFRNRSNLGPKAGDPSRRGGRGA